MMDTTESGREIAVRLEHPRNARLEMFCTPSDTTSFCREVQPLKIAVGTVTSPEGRVILLSEVQLLKQ